MAFILAVLLGGGLAYAYSRKGLFDGAAAFLSVLSAALAMVTERIQLRAGSVVLPLRHPIRIVEEWAVVDNLSKVLSAGGWLVTGAAEGVSDLLKQKDYERHHPWLYKKQ